jgi:hypothetical protein
LSDKVLAFRPSTFTAKLFSVPCGAGTFMIAGTLDGFVDLATPESGTYQMSTDEASRLAEALRASVVDIEANCKYEEDPLLQP